MSEKHQHSRRGDKRNLRRGGGGNIATQPYKEYKRVVSPAETNSGGRDTSTTPPLGSIKLDGQGKESRDEPRTSPPENDTTPKSSAASDVPHSGAPPIQTDPHREDSCPNSASGDNGPAAANAPIRDGTSRDVSLQFGSVGSDAMNEMKVPPIASAAPSNPDENRWKQGNYIAFRPKHIVAPSFYNGIQSRVDNKQMNEIPPQTQPQRNMYSPLQTPVVTGTMGSSLPTLRGPMTPLQQSHSQIKYGMPSPQIQSSGFPPSPNQMPMQLTDGGPHQLRQPLFVPGLPPHHSPLPHGPVHQGHGFNFSPQFGPQLSPQPGRPMGMSPRFPQQHHIANLSPRRTVKITHPNTLEDVKLDERADGMLVTGSSGHGSHHHSGIQMHPMVHNHSHSPRYFPHAHPAPVISPGPGSIPPASSSGPSNMRFSSPGIHGTNEINQVLLREPPLLDNSQKESKVRTEHVSVSSQPAANAASSVTPSQRTADSIAALSSTAMENVDGYPQTKEDNNFNHQKEGKNTEHTTSSVKPLETKEKNRTDLNIAETSFSKEQSALGLNKNDQGKSGGANLKTDDGEYSPSANSSKSSSIYRVKSETTKGKKKRKELLQRSDAAGSTSDLFPSSEKNSESTVSSECTLSFSRKGSSNFSERDIGGKDDTSKLEPDDWDHSEALSCPKLEKCNETEVSVSEHGIAPIGKNYSRDFLLTLSQKCTKIPSNFRITYDIVEALLDPKAIMPTDVGHNMTSGWEQITEKPGGVVRPGGHGSGLSVDGRWNKSAKSVSSGFEPRIDVSHRGNAHGFRSGQGGTQGGLRSPRDQASGLSHLVSPGGTWRNGPDTERWNASRVQQVVSPVLVMHKADKKYKIRNVSDAEEAKQRQLKAILNKLTPQNFDRLFEQVKEVHIDNAETLSGVIAQIFDKALMEPTFCEMYANFCYHLAGELPDFIENEQKITFKRLLLNKCQEEFERGEREQSESDRDEGEVKLSEQEKEEKRISARRKMLGNIRLIGELYKKKMLTERIMHECIQKLLGQYQNPDEEDIESLCKLMSTIGEMIEHPKAREYMDAYFEIMTNLSNNMNLSSRVRFMLKDVIELRQNKWRQRRKVEGPKKIAELHRDAAQEKQASRMPRGSSFSSSRRGQPADFGHRKPTILSPPHPQLGSARGIPPPVSGFGAQDVRLENRTSANNRTLPVHLPHRPMDAQVSHGAKGGLAKGLHGRGPPMLSGPPRMDSHSSFGDIRGPEWRPYNTNHEPMTRPHDNFTRPTIGFQAHRQGHANPSNSGLTNLAHSPGRPTMGHLQRPATLNISPGKAYSEEHLSNMSIAAIKEFYSAKDENELILCVKDMDAPRFHPAMISLWVNDSFERKNWDRDLLSRLLVNLTKSREGILSINQLSDGFKLVLANLEDTVTDAPKAAAYLGQMLGRIVIENAMSLSVIRCLLQQGGEKPGQLIQNMLGYEVLENVLEVIKLEKGESLLEEMCKNSNVRLEEFGRPALK